MRVINTNTPKFGAGVSAAGQWRELEHNAGYAEGYKDLTADFSGAGLKGIRDPVLVDFVGDIPQYSFSAGQLRELTVNFHFNHDIKQGSLFYPHVHWTPSDDSAGVVRWGMEYTLALGHNQEAFPVSETIYVEQAAAEVDRMHQIAEYAPGIDFAALEPDILLVMRVFRDGTHVNDTYPNAVFGLCADIHYLADRETTPNKAPDFYS
ncbi:MAG: hypothetical protein GY941_19895 [Planctomycetes bacterium]|nr:hypothetical protein [Planctomycetota bacterium]